MIYKLLKTPLETKGVINGPVDAQHALLEQKHRPETIGGSKHIEYHCTSAAACLPCSLKIATKIKPISLAIIMIPSDHVICRKTIHNLSN